jgi:uncharacterized small protein (DUF1192 family)
MITVEMLNTQQDLVGLTDAQKQAIALLSKNDEEMVIGNRFREVYNRLDESIAKETGIARNGDEKTYNYLERAARELAAKANSVSGLNERITTLTAERDRLKKALEDGTADDKLKKDLAQALKDLDSVKGQYNTLKTDYDKAKAEHLAEMENYRIDTEVARVTGSIKFKAELPESATSVLMQQAISKVKALKHDYIDDGKGGKQLVFLDATDTVMRNPEKQLNPYTIGDLITKELKTMGVLDEGRRQNGLQTTPPKVVNTENGIVIDVTGAKTRTEATEMITQALLKQGIINGSKEFQEAMTQAWKDNNIAALPM